MNTCALFPRGPGPRLPFILAGLTIVLAIGLGIAVWWWAKPPTRPEPVEVALSGPGSAEGRQRANVEALAALGYVEWVETNDTRVGVTQRSPHRPALGLRLYKSAPRHEAVLMTPDGEVVHTWTAPDSSGRSWHHVEPLSGGGLLGIVKTRAVERLDRHSTLLWRTEVGAHHDLDVDAAGRVLVLTEDVRRVRLGNALLPVIDHGIAVISPEGQVEREVWLSTLFADRIPAERIDDIARHVASNPDEIHRKIEVLDVFHANSIEILDRDLEPIARRGDVLVSIRELDLIAILDLRQQAVVWSWGSGVLDRQHQPSLQANGHLLIFDNGVHRGWSRVIEVDPASGDITWEYHGDPPESFFSSTRGGCERLPNGNVLIVESNDGRAFEVTPEGETVWEFLNPDMDTEKGQRATIYRMTWLAETAVEEWLPGVEGR